MTSKEKIGISKNFFCRDQYWQIISTLYGDQVFKNAPGATLRKCKFGENCRGAHSEDEIHTLPHNYNFTKLDKSKLDLVDIYNNICDVFDKAVVIHPGFRKELDNYKNLDFVELLNFWFKITCYHRKAKKEFKNGIQNEYYKDINEIPEFFLRNEEIIWPFERITKLCPKHLELIRKINYEKEKPILWDICCGSINCKEGCHNISYMICKDDLIKGSCDCMSLSDFNEKQDEIKLLINNIRKNLEGVDEFGFKKKLTSKKKRSLESKISTLKKELSDMKRKIHLTEEGLIPFNQQMINYKELLQKKKDEDVEKVKKLKNENDERVNTMNKSFVKKKVKKPVF